MSALEEIEPTSTAAMQMHGEPFEEPAADGYLWAASPGATPCPTRNARW